jgi:hypothetical protein
MINCNDIKHILYLNSFKIKKIFLRGETTTHAMINRTTNSEIREKYLAIIN